MILKVMDTFDTYWLLVVAAVVDADATTNIAIADDAIAMLFGM